MGRNRSYDISAARTHLGHWPRISFDACLRGMAPQPAGRDSENGSPVS